MPKKTFIFSLLTLLIGFGLLIFNFTKTEEVEASPGTGDNVWGWAWSENIGWIKFNNCTDPTNPGTCESVNYGVNIDPVTGIFSGYAWSENIGWITFNESELGGCPSAPCRAWVDLGGGQQVFGWARALAYGGGWDGWIKLSDTNYGVWIDTSVSPAEFRDWAWSDMVIGWVSFNCANQGVCGTSDYKVMTSFVFVPPNQPPYVEPGSAIITDERYCDIAPSVGQISFEWTYQDNDGDNQSHYHLQVATDPGFNNKVVDSEISQSVSPDEKGTSAVLIVPDPTTYSRCTEGGDFEGRCVAYGNSYYWRVRVKAATGNQDWSGWEMGSPSSFTTDSHAYPWPDFDWAPSKPSVGEVVQLCATIATSTCDISKLSICYDAASNPISCTGAFNWTIPSNAEFATGTNPSSENPRIRFLSMAGENKVKLRITDGIGFCEKEKDIGQTAFPLPEYKEVPPIIWLKNFLAWLANIFARF